MFELLVIIAFVWLSIKMIGLGLRITWGAAKIVAALLFVMALPALVLCLIFAGGVLLLIPVALVGIAWGILKSV